MWFKIFHSQSLSLWMTKFGVSLTFWTYCVNIKSLSFSVPRTFNEKHLWSQVIFALSLSRFAFSSQAEGDVKEEILQPPEPHPVPPILTPSPPSAFPTVTNVRQDNDRYHPKPVIHVLATTQTQVSIDICIFLLLWYQDDLPWFSWN